MVDKTSTFNDMLKTVEEVPALPEVFHQLMEALDNPLSTAEHISKIIGTDPGITSKVLKLVNSAFYGFPSQITSITRAVVILGFNEVRNMVIATSVIGSFLQLKGDQKGIAKQLWRHSLGVAIISKNLGRKVGLADSDIEDIFVAGLLHDIGKLVHLSSLPKDFEIIHGRSKTEELPYQVIEQEQLGFDHTYTARILLKSWRLPQALRFIVSRHHRPRVENKLKRSVAVVHVADALGHLYKLAELNPKKIPRIDKVVWEGLSLEPEALASVEQDAREKLKELCAILEIG